MFFLIAGVQPKTVKLDEQPRMCPSCGLYQAFRKRVDQYVAVFFLPIVRVRRGTPFLECRSCGTLTDESGRTLGEATRTRAHACTHCGRPVERDHRYCPFCGRPFTP